jgi:signal transduction histidine kinase
MTERSQDVGGGLAAGELQAADDAARQLRRELESPLHAILGFAQLMQRDKKAPLLDRQRARVDHILKSGEQLLRTIDAVLAHAEITPASSRSGSDSG